MDHMGRLILRTVRQTISEGFSIRRAHGEVVRSDFFHRALKSLVGIINHVFFIGESSPNGLNSG